MNYQKRSQENNSIYNHIKKNKIPRNKLVLKVLYAENYKMLMKDVENDTKKWKDIPCSWIGKLIFCFTYTCIYSFSNSFPI